MSAMVNLTTSRVALCSAIASDLDAISKHVKHVKKGPRSAF
jgi:hypothetical protein